MRKAVIFLMAIAIALALGPAAMGGGVDDIGGRKSRFLADEKCSVNPSVCNRQGLKCCGDECVETKSDAYNCGKCGNTCKFTEACCGGKCVYLQFDKKNCGSCFNKCKKSCLYGLCDYA
ncbi:stigma-specific STIG1-like protein 3 [Canna indica]|uniref:Stigma-specific STIG1-like protein 3 n=1 Tax=Canna indica TaxID=4628 RepID=A0AAQ3K5Z5_9LILI|nr:stigma-specific STIG1-like protein 3 [Canna indica]